MSIPLRELQFDLFEILRLEQLWPDGPETATAILEAADDLAATAFAPYAAKADIDEPFVRDGQVVLPAETRAAQMAVADAGFIGTAFPAEYGGSGLPFTLSQACGSIFAASNVGFYSYSMLTQGAANLLLHFGSAAQREHWVPQMLAGRVFGTMCLSEPQAGSSLADITTLATLQPDGRYLLRGRKMWISGGEHELSENIVHLVLARTPNAPAGVKGISLFLVPRFRNASTRERNGVTLIGLNHKMGWRAHVNTALAFGDGEDCVGELIGELHQGLQYMFLMMNEARVTVGLAAAAIGFAGYTYSLAYARERRQGRASGSRSAESPQVPIVEHADVRRMLLAQKAWVEGGVDLVLYCARLVDELRTVAVPAQQVATPEPTTSRSEASLLLDLLTPVAKSWPAEYGLEANKLAIQIAGGAGYTRDLPLERLYRDNRLNHIHEGAFGIHGLDLLGRKVVMHAGAAFGVWCKRLEHTIDQVGDLAQLQFERRELARAKSQVELTTEHLVAAMQSARQELALANATPYLDAFGTVTVAWRWLERARVAARRLAELPPEHVDIDFYTGKLAACRYFYRYELPRALATLEMVSTLDDTVLLTRNQVL